MAAARAARRAGREQFIVQGLDGPRSLSFTDGIVDFRGVTGAPLEAVDLLEGLDLPQHWPVRDQGHRGTCVAFAVAAAEELAEFRAGRGLPTYFEEDLYCATRKVPLAEIGIPDSVIAEGSGATFLAQAAIAIRRGGLRQQGTPYRNDPALPVDAMIDCQPATPGAAGPDQDHAVKTAASNQVVPVVHLPKARPLIETFHAALRAGNPVVVALPLVQSKSHALFESNMAKDWGLVMYPTDDDDVSSPVADVGHAVCVVGYRPSDEAGHEGWFVFRNSLGDQRFARRAASDTSLTRAPAPGFGLIAAAAVERWSWEYMHRA
jgi:hypothetical protein